MCLFSRPQACDRTYDRPCNRTTIHPPDVWCLSTCSHIRSSLCYTAACEPAWPHTCPRAIHLTHPIFCLPTRRPPACFPLHAWPCNACRSDCISLLLSVCPSSSPSVHLSVSVRPPSVHLSAHSPVLQSSHSPAVCVHNCASQPNFPPITGPSDHPSVLLQTVLQKKSNKVHTNIYKCERMKMCSRISCKFVVKTTNCHLIAFACC